MLKKIMKAHPDDLLALKLRTTVFRKPMLTAAVLLLAGLIIRLYAATTVPLISDEEDFSDFARKISFDTKQPYLPLGGDGVVDCPPLVFYVAKVGLSLLGDSVLGMRFFFVLIGVLSLFFSYKTVEEASGPPKAIIVLCFLTFSQYHIGISRLIGLEVLHFFFVVLSIYFFFKALRTGENRWFYGTGISLGVGYLGRELVILLLPVFMLFLLCSPPCRVWLRRRVTYTSLAFMLLCMSPQIIWSVENNFRNYTSKDDHLMSLGISLRNIYLYFGEVFAWMGDTFVPSGGVEVFPAIEHAGTIIVHDGKFVLLMDGDNEFPFEHWVMGIMIVAAVFYYFLSSGNKGELMKFSMLMFFFIGGITTVAGYHPLQLCSDHMWATATLYPGAILSAHMMIGLSRKYKIFEFAVLVIIIYFVINSVRFILLPENQFAVSKMVLCKYYMKRVDIYMQEGNENKVRDRCSRVLSQCPNSIFGKRAQEILDKME